MSFSSCTHCKCRGLAKQWLVGDLIHCGCCLWLPVAKTAKYFPYFVRTFLETNQEKQMTQTRNGRLDFEFTLLETGWKCWQDLSTPYHWFFKNWILITTVFIMMSRVLIIWWWLLLMEWEVISVYCWSACQPLITALIWNPLMSTDCVWVCSLFVFVIPTANYS